MWIPLYQALFSIQAPEGYEFLRDEYGNPVFREPFANEEFLSLEGTVHRKIAHKWGDNADAPCDNLRLILRKKRQLLTLREVLTKPIGTHVFRDGVRQFMVGGDLCHRYLLAIVDATDLYVEE